MTTFCPISRVWGGNSKFASTNPCRKSPHTFLPILGSIGSSVWAVGGVAQNRSSSFTNMGSSVSLRNGNANILFRIARLNQILLIQWTPDLVDFKGPEKFVSYCRCLLLTISYNKKIKRKYFQGTFLLPFLVSLHNYGCYLF